MTRLRTTDVAGMATRLAGYERQVRSATGLTLAGLARRAAGCGRARPAAELSFCVVPISSGKGIIPGFCRAVRDILNHVGFKASVAPCADREGLAYARGLGNTVVMWADDRRFVAETPDGRVIDNTEATARGYGTALERMAGGLCGEPVLLLGCGRLGRAAAAWLHARGARLTVFDPVEGRARSLAWASGATMADSVESGLASHDLVLIAADAPGLVGPRYVRPGVRVAAPGMPCGVTPAARRRLGGRCLHDPLAIGVATMAFLALGCADAGRGH